jgi:NTE family protein
LDGRVSGREPAAVKRVNLALQGGGSHGAYTWGALDALLEDQRIEIAGVSGASAGAMNAVVLAAGLQVGGRDGARKNLAKFWLAVSQEGVLATSVRPLFDAWVGAWKAFFLPPGWLDALSQASSPYSFNPLNMDPLGSYLAHVVDFEQLRAGSSPKLFVAATNVRTGQGEVFRRDVLTQHHVLASACLPHLFQSVLIDGVPYWDGGYSGNPPLWPLFFETDCNDCVIIQINPIERDETPKSAQEIGNRIDEITYNAGLLAELRAADFVKRLIDEGALTGPNYRRELLHRIGGDGKLETFGAETKLDSSWTFLTMLRDLGRDSAEQWLKANFDAIGETSTLDVAATLRKPDSPPAAVP